MEKINLYNRDGATMWLEKISLEDTLWKLKVDPKHSYCLTYMRCGGEFDILETPEGKQKIEWKVRKMIDPSGGPYLEVGDKIDKYHLVEIVDDTILRLEE